jgi:hypothetical protein
MNGGRKDRGHDPVEAESEAREGAAGLVEFERAAVPIPCAENTHCETKTAESAIPIPENERSNDRP